MGNRFYLIKEFWEFVKLRKAWWLMPVIISLVLAGVLIIAAQSSSIGPFIYVLF